MFDDPITNGGDPGAGRTWRPLTDDVGSQAPCDCDLGTRDNPDRTVQVPTPTPPEGC